MVGLLWEGFIYGLTLTMMIGPIFIALLQTGIDKGFRAGFIVGLGIWTSDIIIITVLISLMTNVKQPVTIDSSTTHWGGIVGGIILMAFGVGSMLRKTVPTLNVQAFSAKNLTQLWVKGFVVNTVNPFTFIFWISLVSAYNLGKHITAKESLIFYGTILFTIMTTDSLKVYLSKKIRSKLTPQNVLHVSKLAGALLFIFGIVLIFRTW